MSESDTVSERLLASISAGEYEDFKALLQHSNVNEQLDGLPLIHHAIKEDQFVILKELINHGADVDIKDDNNEETPLHAAVKENRPQCLEVLLSKSADVNQQNRNGDTPLHIALQKNRLNIAKALLKKNPQGRFVRNIDIDLVNHKGESPRAIITRKNNPSWASLIETSEQGLSEAAEVEPTNRQAPTFEVTQGGMAGMEGNVYQALIFILVCMRAHNLYERFEVMTELKAAGKFDDIVIKYHNERDNRWHWRFIQLKHKNSDNSEKNKISLDDLSKKKSGFQLSLYLDSIADIRRDTMFANDICEDFIICTTASLDDTTVCYFHKETDKFPEDTLFFFEHHTFKGELNRLVYEKLPDTLKAQATALNGEYNFDEISRQFYFMTSYPTVDTLLKLLPKDLQRYFPVNNAELYSDFFAQRSVDHMLQARGHRITESNFADFIKSITGQLSIQHCIALTEQKISQITAHNMNFRDSSLDDRLVEFLENSVDGNAGFPVDTEYFELMLIKIVNKLSALYLKKDDFFVIDSQNLLNQEAQTKFLDALKFCKQITCVFITKNLPSQFLQTISNLNSRPKMIFLNETPSLQGGDNELCFENLIESTQQMIMNKKVSFQGEERKLKEILSTSAAKKMLNAKALLDILRGEEIRIAKENESFNVAPHHDIYIERILEKNIKEQVNSVKPGSDSKNPVKTMGQELETSALYLERRLSDPISSSRIGISPNNLLDLAKYEESKFIDLIISSKEPLVAIFGEPGLGKSSLLYKLKERIQRNGHWAILINLNDCTLDKKSAYHLSNIDFGEADTTEAIQFLVKMIRPIYHPFNSHDSLTEKLLELRLLSDSSSFSDHHFLSRRPIILLDSFDEIAPEYEEKVFRLIKALKRSESLQMILTTRPHEIAKITQKLQTANYALTSFNAENQLSFFLQNCVSFVAEGIANSSTDRDIISKNFFTLLYIISQDEGKYNDRRTELLNLLQLQEEPVTFSSIDQSLVDNFGDFVSNPLQFRMLFDLCLKPMPLSETSLCQIYENFIEQKFNIFFEDKTHFSGTSAASQIKLAILRDYKMRHWQFAAHSLFPEDFSNCKPKLEELCEIARIGLVIRHGQHHRFIHRSFAEYFVAMFLVDEMSNTHSARMKEIFLQDTHKEICTFINDKLGSIDIKQKYAQLSAADSLNWRSSPSEINVLHVASRRGHTEVLKYFNYILDESTWQHLLKSVTNEGETIFDQAAFSKQYSEIFEVLRVTLETQEFESLLLKSFYCDFRVLESAAKCGDYRKLENFLTKLHPTKDIRNTLGLTNEWGTSIGFLAAIYGTFKRFLEVSAQYLTAGELEAMLLSVVKSGETILHYAVYGQNFAATAQAVLRALGEENLNKLLFQQDIQGALCLHYAAYKGKCEDVLGFVQENFSNFPIEDFLTIVSNEGLNILHIAASQGYFSHAAKTILGALGENKLKDMVFQRDFQGWTCFLMAAVAGKGEDVVAFIQENLTGFPIEELLTMVTEDFLTVLHIAAYFKYFGSTANLIYRTLGEKQLEDIIKKQDSQGRTCIHIAAKFGKCIDLVLDLQDYCDFPIEELFLISTYHGQSVLHIAARNGYFTATANLVFRMVDEETFKILLLKLDIQGWTCLHIALAFGGGEDIVSFLQENLPDFPIEDFLTILTNDGATALHIAANNGCFTSAANFIVRILGRQGVKEMILKPDNEGRTCFQYAAYCGKCEDVINFLRENLPDFPTKEFLAIDSNDGLTALHLAAAKDHFDEAALVIYKTLGEEEFVKMLNKRNIQGATCLHCAAQLGKCKDVVLFLRGMLHEFPMEEFLSISTINGHTVLHIATDNDHFSATANFIFHNLGEENFRKMLMKRNIQGWNCFHIASKRGKCEEVVAFLQENMPHFQIEDLLTIHVNHDQNVLHLAIPNGYFDVTANLLLETLGEEKFREILTQQDTEGITSLHHAAVNGKCEDVLSFLEKEFSNLQMEEFISKKTNLDHSVLHISAETGHFAATADAILRILGPDKFKNLLFERDIDGWTCLFSAAIVGKCEDIVSFLEKNLSDFSIEKFLWTLTNTDETILHLAASQGHFTSAAKVVLRISGEQNFLRLLLKQDNSGQTSLHVASRQKGYSEEVISFLQILFPDLPLQKFIK